jgi:hypothetical protein
MLRIRWEQMEAFRAHARIQLRSSLFFRFSARQLPFDIAELAAQIDTGLAEAARLNIAQRGDVIAFLETVFTVLGRFRVAPDGSVAYPPPVARFLEALEVPAAERILRFAQFTAWKARG